MRILVQKFGGTSLATADARIHVMRNIIKALHDGYKVVVVVSAMGRMGEPYATDTLLSWMEEHGTIGSAREKDMLLCCGEIISAATLASLLHKHRIAAAVLTGGQAGILTNEKFGNAQIISVQPTRVQELLNRGQVAIITGFQGTTVHGDLTTLGRGGSDTTATAIAAALHAERVDIYTDVNGILTADPKVVEEAKPLPVVTYAELCNMAYHGAKVVHPRAVEIAMHNHIPLRVRSTFIEGEGTLVTSRKPADQQRGVIDRIVTGIAHVPNITQIEIVAGKGEYDLQLEVFKAMAQHHISVDFINVNPSGVVYTIYDNEASKAEHILRNLGYKPKCLSHCAKVSIVGGGMNGVPGIMAKIVEALAEAEIPILQSADSNTTIWVLVHGSDMIHALRSLHSRFNLHRSRV